MNNQEVDKTEVTNEEQAQPTSTDNVGNLSVEIDVETLLAEVKSEGVSKSRAHKDGARQRLEDILESKRSEQQMQEIDDYDYDLDS